MGMANFSASGGFKKPTENRIGLVKW
jgi:hypothetical protein